MKLIRNVCTFAGALFCVNSFTTAQDVIANIDFEGRRPGDELTPNVLFAGASAFGSTGTTYNALALSSDGSNSTTTGDNQTVTAPSLLDQTNAPTTISFTTGPIGGDINGVLGLPSDQSSLYADYFFNNSAGNGVGPDGSPFTFSGLPGDTADIFVYASNPGNGVATISNAANGAQGVFTTLNGFAGRFFDNVPISAGSITGTFADLSTVGQETAVIGGISIQVVPEPTSVGLLAFGALGLLARRRRA